MSSHTDTRPILVTGATGKQGGAVAQALLQAGRSVRALTRNPASAAGKALTALGADVVKGDYNDPASLDAALAGIGGVFSVQLPSGPVDPAGESREGQALIEAAHRTNVDVFVQTSVARAGDHENFDGWTEGRWEPTYWKNKAAVNEMVKAQGFKHWVILKPAMIMENLLPPVAEFMFPSLADRGQFDTAIEPDTRLDWIAAQDIGAFAAAAFTDPERFHGREIDLAAESLTMEELAAKLAQGTGKPVSAMTSAEDELVARGNNARVVQSQVWDNVEGYKVDIEAVRNWGVPLTTLDQFIEQNRDTFAIG